MVNRYRSYQYLSLYGSKGVKTNDKNELTVGVSKRESRNDHHRQESQLILS